MKISKLMSRDLVAVNMDDSLGKVKEIFEKTNFHHVLVVDESRLFGVISDRDLLKSLSPKIDTAAATARDLASLNKRAHQIMTRNPITLSEDDTIKSAVDIFNHHTISCIPIVNRDDKPVGIVSWRDIMRELGRRL